MKRTTKFYYYWGTNTIYARTELLSLRKSKKYITIDAHLPSIAKLPGDKNRQADE